MRRIIRQCMEGQAQSVDKTVCSVGAQVEACGSAPRSLNLILQVGVDVLSTLYVVTPHRDIRTALMCVATGS